MLIASKVKVLLFETFILLVLAAHIFLRGAWIYYWKGLDMAGTFSAVISGELPWAGIYLPWKPSTFPVCVMCSLDILPFVFVDEVFDLFTQSGSLFCLSF